MNTQEKIALENHIISIVEEDDGNTIGLVGKMRKECPTVSESDIRNTIWRLVDRGQISLTQNRKWATKNIDKKEISKEEFMENVKTLNRFEVGKYYKHASGKKMAIRGEVYTCQYGNTLIGEMDGGDLRPIDKSSDAVQGWVEISEEEFLNDMSLEVGGYYKYKHGTKKIKIVAFVEKTCNTSLAEDLFIGRCSDGTLEIIRCVPYYAIWFEEISEYCYNYQNV